MNTRAKANRSPLYAIGIIASAAACLLFGVVLAFSAIRNLREVPTPEQPDLAKEAQDDLDKRKYRPLSGPLESLLKDTSYKSIPTQTHPLLGQAAPDFTLVDTEGKPETLSETLKRTPVVLVFYYGYACDHCVSQLFALNKDLEKFRELGATVWAVSADPPELTLRRFKQYGPFAFPVLSDPDHKVAAQYGTYVPSKIPGEDGDLMHGTILINRSGRVVWSNRGDAPFTENRTLLLELSRFRK